MCAPREKQVFIIGELCAIISARAVSFEDHCGAHGAENAYDLLLIAPAALDPPSAHSNLGLR